MWSHAMKIPLKAFATVDDEIDLFQSVHLLYYALQEGYHQSRRPFTITVDDCFGFTDTDPGIVVRLFELMAEVRSVNVPGAEVDTGEKKMI